MKTKLAVVLAMVFVMDAAAENLIKNGDFSKANSSGVAQGFVQGRANDVYSAPKLEIIKADNLSYLQVKMEDGERTRFRPEHSVTHVEKGKTYTMNVRVRGTGDVMFLPKFRKRGSQLALFGETSWQAVSIDWSDLSFEWTAPSDGDVTLLIQVRGSADIDEWFWGVKE